MRSTASFTFCFMSWAIFSSSFLASSQTPAKSCSASDWSFFASARPSLPSSSTASTTLADSMARSVDESVPSAFPIKPRSFSISCSSACFTVSGSFW